MSDDPRSAMIQDGNIMRIENALVEETFCFNDSSGYIIVSYSVPGENNTSFIEYIRLNFSRNTVIINSFRQNVCPCCLQKGMWVNVIFSSRMTRSIPPQSGALLIVVKRGIQTPSSVTTAPVAYVDPSNNFLYTGNPNNINSQTRFLITDTTTITNRFGNPVSLSALRPGQLVRIRHANAMTASIPPQTTAFAVQLV